MNSVGIDVSKGKSTVAAVNFTKDVVLTPGEFEHTEIGLERLIYEYLLPIDGDVRVIISCGQFPLLP